ncbi:MAG: hypothetical protein FI734_06135 [SAR202 cluster bacterium]|nr:hypothetical protein [SAR202 cluster bacterium]
MANETAKILNGVSNLVNHCASVQKGENVLLINERGAMDSSLIDLIEEAIINAGGRPISLWTEPVNSEEQLQSSGFSEIHAADKLILNSTFNRVALLNFLTVNNHASLTRVNNRIRTLEAIATAHSLFDWRLVMALARKIEEITQTAKTYRITTPQGTDIVGRIASASEVADAFFVQDAELSRTERVFPGEVYAPVGSADARGVIAFDHPGIADRHPFQSPMLLSVTENKLQRINWKEESIRANQRDDSSGNTIWSKAQLQSLLDRNVERYGFEDAYQIDSFHGGFHPKAQRKPGQQSNSDVMHFHIGRIPASLSAYISNHSIELDGVPFWQNGSACLLHDPDIKLMAKEYGENL